jgi:hypothetical protein
MQHERIARVEKISDDGSFPMTLATEAEASDGHILSIRGGQIPEQMPLLVSHWNDPSGTAGSITSPIKQTKASPPRLRAVGHIELGGEGAPAAIRRDLAHMIRQGHVGAVSIRWDEVPGKSIRRVNLPESNPFHVNLDTEKDPRKRYGIYFDEWRAVEGSVVAVGADPKALIGRAIETEGEVRTFWREMARDLEPSIESIRELMERADHCREQGHKPVDILNAAACVDWDPRDLVASRIGVRTFFLPADLAVRMEDLLDQEQGLSEPARALPSEPERAPDPAPETVQRPAETPVNVQPAAALAYSPAVVAEEIRSGLREARTQLVRDTVDALNRVSGKVRR